MAGTCRVEHWGTAFTLGYMGHCPRELARIGDEMHRLELLKIDGFGKLAVEHLWEGSAIGGVAVDGEKR